MIQTQGYRATASEHGALTIAKRMGVAMEQLNKDKLDMEVVPQFIGPVRTSLVHNLVRL